MTVRQIPRFVAPLHTHTHTHTHTHVYTGTHTHTHTPHTHVYTQGRSIHIRNKVASCNAEDEKLTKHPHLFFCDLRMAAASLNFRMRVYFTFCAVHMSEDIAEVLVGNEPGFAFCSLSCSYGIGMRAVKKFLATSTSRTASRQKISNRTSRGRNVSYLDLPISGNSPRAEFPNVRTKTEGLRRKRCFLPNLSVANPRTSAKQNDKTVQQLFNTHAFYDTAPSFQDCTRTASRTYLESDTGALNSEKYSFRFHIITCRFFSVSHVTLSELGSPPAPCSWMHGPFLDQIVLSPKTDLSINDQLLFDFHLAVSTTGRHKPALPIRHQITR